MHTYRTIIIVVGERNELPNDDDDNNNNNNRLVSLAARFCHDENQGAQKTTAGGFILGIGNLCSDKYACLAPPLADNIAHWDRVARECHCLSTSSCGGKCNEASWYPRIQYGWKRNIVGLQNLAPKHVIGYDASNFQHCCRRITGIPKGFARIYKTFGRV